MYVFVGVAVVVVTKMSVVHDVISHHHHHHHHQYVPGWSVAYTTNTKLSTPKPDPRQAVGDQRGSFRPRLYSSLKDCGLENHIIAYCIQFTYYCVWSFFI